MELLALFPTPVCRAKMAPLSDAERQAIDSLGEARRPNEGNTVSDHRRILNDPRLARLKAEITVALQSYFNEVAQAKSRPEIKITQSWLNFTATGEWHHKHAHPCSLLSAVYYVETDAETDRIYFYREGYNRIEFPAEAFNPFNSRSWWLPVATGDLLIFPSELAHNVPPVQREGHTRISLALNTWFSGTAGSADELTELICESS